MSAARLSLFALVAVSLPLATSADEPRPVRGNARPLVASISRPPVSHMTELQGTLPPLPEGVTELKFSEFFKTPVGARGMEPSEKLRQLDGRKVRLVGYFVFEDWTACSCPPDGAAPVTPVKKGRPAPPAWMKHVVPGRAMFAPMPVAVSLGHFGLSDDLPLQVAFLNIADRFGEPVFFRPGIYTATGTVSLGNRDEADGRVSYVRLAVERDSDIQPAGRAATLSQANPIPETNPTTQP